MSSREDMESDAVRQDKNPPNLQTDDHAEFYRLGCIVLNLIILLVSGKSARNWGKRLELWSHAPMIPPQGYGDIRAVAAYLNMSEDGAYDLVNRLPNIPKYKPGTSVLYRFDDIARLSPIASDSQSSTGVEPKKGAPKRTGKNQG